MKKYTLLSILILIVLLAFGCTSEKSKGDNEALRTMSAENIRLVQENTNLRAENDQLKVDVTTLEQNLELAMMSQEELAGEMANASETVLSQAKKTESFEALFKYSISTLSTEGVREYGELVYSRIGDLGFKQFVTSLSQEPWQKADNVTTYLALYTIGEGFSEKMLLMIETYRSEATAAEQSTEIGYILNRLEMLIGEK